MRKLLSLVAVLFMLAVALLAKPAIALPPCDCWDFCPDYPHFYCLASGLGSFRCSTYMALYCSY